MDNESSAVEQSTREQEAARMDELRQRIISRLSVSDILQLLERKIMRAISDADEAKSRLDDIDFDEISRFAERIDVRHLEDIMSIVDDYDFDSFITEEGLSNAFDEIESQAREAYDVADKARDGVRELFERIENTERKIEEGSGSEDLQIQIEGFKEELESLSQRQDLMDERIGRFERIYNVFRLAISNDPK
jgi:methyl-accepting chemotaxis protein